MPKGKGAEHAERILSVLKRSDRPLSAYDLLEHLRPTGVSAPLTVYRALNTLVRSGSVHRIESLNAFVACKGNALHDHGHGDAHEHTVAFAICDGCGSVEEFADDELCDRINATLSKRAFVPRASALEIHGRCLRCAAEGPSA